MERKHLKTEHGTNRKFKKFINKEYSQEKSEMMSARDKHNNSFSRSGSQKKGLDAQSTARLRRSVKPELT